VLSAYDTTLRVNRILDAADAQLLMVSNVEARIRNLQNRVKGASKWLLTLAVLLIVGVILLHFLDLNPDARTDGPIPNSGRRWVHWIVFAVIIFLVFAIVGQVRRLMGAERASADSPDD
jgi:hypothetical protein